MNLIFLALFPIPFLYRFFFWSYVFQLKEYRFDRLKEYLNSPQGKKGLFSKFIFFDIILLILFITSFFYKDILVEYAIVGLFGILNIFYIYKILIGQLFLPKFSFRYFLIYFLSLFFILILTYFSFNYYILIILLIFPYLIIFLSNFLVLPFVNLGKKITIYRAEKKSRKNGKTIKIGITGSFGKSSVKEYLAYLLDGVGKILSTPKNINTEIGVSNIINKKLSENYDYFVAEMGAYKIGEIKTLGEIVNHKYGFLTGIGTQHIGLFGSQENIKTGKSEIALKVLENNGILYLNWDNQNIRETTSIRNLKNIVKYGKEPENDAKYEIISFENSFLKFRFLYKNIDIVLETNLLGEHNILNLTGVLAFLIDQNLNLEIIKERLLTMPVIKHTLEVIKKDDLTIIDDSYNLSVDSLLSGIEVMSYFSGKKVLVLDDILELGEDSDKIHFELGEKVGKQKNVDKVLFVGSNYKKSFLNGLKYSFFPDENIISNLDNISGETIVLFEGRGSEKYLNGLLKK